MQEVDQQTLQALAKFANIRKQLDRFQSEEFETKPSDIRLLEHDVDDLVNFLKKLIPEAGKRLEKSWNETDREKIKEALDHAKEEKVNISSFLRPLSQELDALKNQYLR